ncbi:P-loop NTPase fold protein [Paraburkholderia aspalathi]|uniref:P-loop NTPase fold protein n=1 Tax=Paraburkholderia aspalathi TaxID=1324617 RepID=UPI0038BBBEC3
MNRQPPVLLSDEPSANDGLGGAHERIADAIAELFNNSAGGKSIRIDGEWGAGKSTIVRMLMRKLEQTASGTSQNSGKPDYAVFLYDAWVHSGDPLKRAFFTAMLDKFQQKEWLQAVSPEKNKRRELTRAYWDDQLDVLSSRVRRSQRKESPSFSIGARLSIALLAAFGASIPYILKLLDYLGQNFGSTAVGLIVVVLVFATVRYVPERILNYFLLRSSDTKKTETLGDYSPTSIDFQDVFGKLVAAVMEGNERRVIVVVDNLDRINEAEIKEVWGLLRSFLDNPIFAKTEWFHRLWVVVPVANAPKLSASISEKGELGSNSNTFLEKAFQVRFKLPPPMLHSWKSYMRVRLQEAFGAEEGNEYEDVQRIYEIYLSDAGQDKDQPVDATSRFVRAHVTPRAIVSFVNDLVAMRLERGNQIGLPLLAAYQLAAASGKKDVHDLPIRSKRVDSVLKSERLADVWAMLHYHAADPDEASYIVAYPVIDRALQEGNAEAVKAEVEKSPGASHILQRYIYEGLPELKGIALVRAAYALQSLLVVSSPNFPDLASVSKRFSERTVANFKVAVQTQLEASVRLDIGDNLIVEGVSALFDILPNRDETARLVVKLLAYEGADAKTPFDNIRDGKALRNWDSWVHNLVKLVDLDPIRRLLQSSDGIKLHVLINEGEWATLMARFGNAEYEWLLDAVRPALRTPLKMNEWFAEHLLLDQIHGEAEDALRYFIRNNEANFNDISRKVIALQLPQQSKAQQTRGRIPQSSALVAISWLLATNQEGMRELLRGWMSDEVVLLFLEQARHAGEFTSLVKWALLALWTAEGILPPRWHSAPTNARQIALGVGGSAAFQTSVPGWIRATKAVFLDVSLANKIDEQELAGFIVGLKLFDILSYSEIATGISGRIFSLVAKSDVLHQFLEKDGLDVKAFASKYINADAFQQQFIAKFEAGSTSVDI